MSDHDVESSNGERRRHRSAGGIVLRVFILLVLIAAAGAIWFYLKSAVPPPQPESVLPVQTIQPTVGKLERTITLDSYVESQSVVTVLPKVSGQLVELNAEVGTHLKAGEVIAKIDPTRFQLEENQAKALYDGAKSVYERLKKLASSGAASQQNFDEARTQYENARSEYALAKLHLSYTTIVSPVNGTVVERHVSNGALVAPSVPIVTITDNRALVIHTHVPEQDVRLFEQKRKTMPITATIPAMGAHAYPLRIRTIAPLVDVTTKTFTVECEFTGETNGIFPGMFAQVRFVLDSKTEIPYLPYGVLVGGNTLWYVSGEDRAESIDFTPSYHNDDFFEVPQKYREYHFILSGQHFLTAGAPVRVVRGNQVTQ